MRYLRILLLVAILISLTLEFRGVFAQSDETNSGDAVGGGIGFLLYCCCGILFIGANMLGGRYLFRVKNRNPQTGLVVGLLVACVSFCFWPIVWIILIVALPKLPVPYNAQYPAPRGYHKLPTQTMHTPLGGIFVSYRRADSHAITDRIYERLAQVFGREYVFKDVDNIPAGLDFRGVIDRAVQQSRIILVVIGRQWATLGSENGRPRIFEPNDYVRLEIESGLQNPNIILIPVLVDGAAMPSVDSIPPSIESLVFRNAVVVRNDPDFEMDVRRLVDAILVHSRK